MSHYKPYPEYKDSGVEWLGEVPAHWKVLPLRRIATFKNSNVDKKGRAGQKKVRLCNYTDVYYSEFIFDNQEFMVATASPEEINHFGLRPLDVIITKDSEDPTDIGIPTLVQNAGEDLVCGYHLTLIRSGNDTLQRLLHRLLQSGASRGYFFQECPGVTRYGLNQNAIGSLPVPLPPVPEAESICNHIDCETTRLDTLITKKQRFIALLKERRQSLITQAVTKGLDPAVPMKESGVEWIGEIPDHWKVLPVKRLSQVKRGASPRPIDDPIYFDDDGDYAWVRIADVSASNGFLETTKQTLSALGSSLSVKLEPGSLFLSIAGTVGKPCINKIKACIHDGFVYFPELAEYKEYLFQIFSTGQCYSGLGKTNTQLNLNTDTVGGINVPVPPNKEVKKILDYIKNETARIDILITKTQHSIDLLKERRASLITAAVTGKIDLRSEVEPKHDMEVA